MIAEIKKGIKLLRYGYALKLNIATTLFFLLLGVLGMCIGESGIFLATVYILMVPLTLVQLESTLLYSGFAASSAKRKILEIYFPDFMTMITGGLGCLIVIGGSFFWAHKRPENIENCIEVMFMSSIMIAIMLIYMAVAYKYFVTGIIMFCLGVFIGIDGGMIALRVVWENFTLAMASGVSVAIIVMGIVISGLLRRAFYRKQISPLAGGFSLRKAMQ